MPAQQQHPRDVAFWELDDETGEVERMGSYTNWPGEDQ